MRSQWQADTAIGVGARVQSDSGQRGTMARVEQARGRVRYVVIDWDSGQREVIPGRRLRAIGICFEEEKTS